MIFLLLVGCKSDMESKTSNKAVEKHEKKQDSSKKETTEDLNIEYPVPPVDFLDEKYKKNGLTLPDGVSGDPTYPVFTFFDKNLGGFNVNYIGKSSLIQNFWDVSNRDGFFGQFEDIDQAMYNTKQINDKVREVLKNKPNDYYIVADFLPKEAISKYYNDGSGEFDLKDNAYTYFYIYENNNWIFIKKILTKKIDKQGIELYNDVLLNHKF